MSAQPSPHEDDGAPQGVLFEEHALLAASFETIQTPAGQRAVPSSYPGVDEQAAFEKDCALADLDGMLMRLVSGGASSAYVEAALAGKRLALGQCSFEALLGGDGSLMSVLLAARTGEQEYGLWDLSARGRLAGEWLGFLAGIEQNGYQPFAEAHLEDAAGRLVPLLLQGPASRGILSDYLGTDVQLPDPGTVANLHLDRIDCLLVAPPELAEGWLVLVPAAYARVLWRSFLSFESAQPVGRHALMQRLTLELPWLAQLESAERIQASRPKLARQHLLRSDGGFVGERGLRS